MSKEYRKEVERILIKFRTEIVDKLDKDVWVDGDKYIDQICKLRPKNQKVIAEGKLLQETDLTAQNRIWGYSLYKDGKITDLFDFFKKHKGKKIIISEEE